jgi:uncharacterized metal-binding protein
MLARTLALIALASSPLVGWLAAWAALGILVGEYWLSPDLDLAPICTPYHWWPWPVRVWWRLYARIIPHRSPLSHWPILGTAGRLVFCCGPGACVALWLGWTPTVVPEVALAFVAGVEASAWLHLLADYS